MKEKTKDILNKFINSSYFPIIIAILIILKTILFYKSTVSMQEEIYKKTIVNTAIFIFGLFGITYIFPRRGRNITAIVIDVIFSILLFADNLYYNYSNNVLSIMQITNIQYGEEIRSTLPMLIKPIQILYFIDLILLAIGFISKFITIRKREKTKNLNNILIRIGVGVLSFSLLFMNCVYSNGMVVEAPYNRDTQIKEATIFGFHVSDIANSFNTKKQAKYKHKDEMYPEYENLKELYNNEYENFESIYESSMNGKNVIILQLESLQEFVVNKKINGKEITPNLNRFLAENIEISNMYMQSYSTTADSEFSTVTSLYPMENGMAYSKYYKNNYDDIFKMFKNAGYTTSYMHGNEGYFWNRSNVYQNMNVDNIELKDKFEDTSEEVMGYLSDELLYKQAVQKMKNYQSPFVSYIVSASSHTGFTLDGLQNEDEKVTIDVGKYKDTFFGNYLESANYADYAFGIFIQELKTVGLYDDTVIILYGDHNGLDMYNEEMIDFLKKVDNNLTDVDIKLNYTRVLAGMKIPGITEMKIEKPVAKLDIKPTLAYLCGLDEGFSLGTNMLGNKNFVCLNNERIITDKYYYDGDWYEINTGNEINETEELKKYHEFMQKELDISRSVILNNMLK